MIIVTSIPLTSFADSNTDSDAITSASKIAQQSMINREDVINVNFEVSDDYNDDASAVIDDFIEDIFLEENKISSKGGDYLYYNFKTMSLSIDCTFDDDTINYAVVLYPVYYDTKEQEDYVDKKTDEIISSLDLSNKTDYEKYKAIYSYVVDNVTYDTTSTSDLRYTAYSALYNHSAVCQGYCNLFELLCNKCGLFVKTVDSTTHSWNIVCLDGKYYLLDATWDSSSRTKDKYFLTCFNHGNNKVNTNSYINEEFYSKHSISDTCYNDCTVTKTPQQDSTSDTATTVDNELTTTQPVTTQEVTTQPTTKEPATTENVKSTTKSTTTAKVTTTKATKTTTTKSTKVSSTSITKITSGKKKITVKWKKQTKGSGYQIQIATDKKFSKNKKTVTIKSSKTVQTTIKKLKSKKKYYVRVRAYKTTNGKKKYSSWSKVKTIKVK